jgi:hypothetical protein
VDVTSPEQAGPQSGQEPYESCDRCASPVERTQRYCVVCGSRRRHANDPAASFMAVASSRARAGAVRRPSTGTARRGLGLLTAAMVAAIPLAAGLGVLVGRGGSNGDDKLLAALRAQTAQVVTVGGLASATPTTTSTAAAPAAPKSTFSLQRGYAVELSNLPGGSSALAVQKAEHAAALNGARAPGVISQSDFRVTPAPAAGDYVIYSGEYRAKTAADRALAKLRTRFPAAKVIAIQAVGASAGAGAVLATSTYGSAHQLTGAKPTPAQVSADRSLINRTTHLIGSNYVNAQKGLPDQTVLP